MVLSRFARLIAVVVALCTGTVLAANPILFVTQMPIPSDFGTIASVFGNHRADPEFVGRGGDLYIAYPDGTLRNLTREAGYGTAGVFQGNASIAVRDPAVHWSGTRAVFAMVVGSPEEQFFRGLHVWQLYEVTGLGQGQTAVITKVPGQPGTYNNIEPTYASNGDLIFVSDRPRNGAAHLYPQLDEYEVRPITTGLWKLARDTQGLTLLQHSPSGSFTPIVNQAGRVVFTRWDHLQRDQENDGANPTVFNYPDEAAGAPTTTDRTEWFPAPRIRANGSPYADHRFNQMFAWQINQDGTEEETLEHIGRHELMSFFPLARIGDAKIVDFVAPTSGRANPNPVSFLLQMREDPAQAGIYVATDAREFEDHGSGQLVKVITSPAGAQAMTIEYLTSRATYCCHDPVDPEHTGHYRNPLLTTDGRLFASHTGYRGTATNLGTRANPRTPFDFRVKRLQRSGTWYAPTTALTAGITRHLQYFDPDVLVSYNGPMWELSPVEVVARAAPVPVVSTLKPPEAQAFAAEGVSPDEFRAYLAERGLGLVSVRDVTRRDAADRQQPFNLRVPGGVQTVAPGGGTLYDIASLQFFQADLVRRGSHPGRRPLARPAQVGDIAELNLFDAEARAPVHADGSVAALVPTRRALSWQTLAPSSHDPVVQERYWITLQPGEIRACDGCHGVNQQDQAGQPAATHSPEALRALLRRWKQVQAEGRVFRDGFE
jgi:hypothetical protein